MTGCLKGYLLHDNIIENNFKVKVNYSAATKEVNRIKILSTILGGDCEYSARNQKGSRHNLNFTLKVDDLRRV